MLSTFFGPTTVVHRVPSATSSISGVPSRPSMRQRVFSPSYVDPRHDCVQLLASSNRTSQARIRGRRRPSIGKEA
ncbi:hypothetical protein KCU65_g446, partial [Aureobasidium melanogenum]